MEKDNALNPFEGKKIRKIWQNEEWYFSVVDIIDFLTDSKNANSYWGKLKEREPQLLTICQRLKLQSTDGKNYNTDCANTEGVFRIIMSVPSPKAEPLKLWLAEQGKRAMDEAENPELSFDRMTELYRAKGHDELWIKERIQSKIIRGELTDEWKNRGVKEGQEYSILTATIAKGTFGLTPSEHAKFKNLGKENLRDHMTRLELILTSLSEEATRIIAVNDDAKNFHENHEAAIKGGTAGGRARRNLEQDIKQSIVSPNNFLHLKESDKAGELPFENKVE